ncbi:hypothetical protein FHETE_1710 [Fusarium heterosporum]|uniref:Uncharacterized protein n=1 Tax=Fusarium heterosporum TaxID=42747 RepID=A0A8H5TV65_FUSHE|nr:hypothetical protein FHETE_1710 [Fusarium heterosporum]
MAGTSTTHVDESISSFYFLDPCVALSFFNNDLTVSVIWSDLGFVSDYNESYEEPSIPPGYLRSFQVQPPLPVIESGNSTTISSSSQGTGSSNNGVCHRKLFNEEIFPPSITNSQCWSPHSDSLGSDGDNDGKQNKITKIHVQTRQKTPSVSRFKTNPSPRVTKVAVRRAPNLPSYHVHQLVAKRSEELKREVEAIWWDTHFTTFASGSSQARGSARYREELKDYRMVRRNAIENGPTARQRASIKKLIGRVREIEDARKQKAKEGWAPRSSIKR